MFSQKRLDPSHIAQFVKSTWLLIDTGSTFNLVCSFTLLTGIKACAAMKSLSNGGSMDYNTSGVLQMLPDPDVSFHVNSLANILSMSSVTTKY